MVDYFGINKIVWNYFKSYLEKVNNDTVDWIKLIEEAGAIYDKYPCEYCLSLLLTQTDELERVYRQKYVRKC